MLKPLVLLVLAACIASTLWVINCTGPQPVVADLRLESPDQPGEPYRVETTVRNDGRGHGQVAVIVRLRERGSGQTYQQERKVELRRDEVARVIAEIPAPPGDYAPEVEVEYPPR